MIGLYSTSTGMPCSHRLQDISRPLTTDDFHSQWILTELPTIATKDTTNNDFEQHVEVLRAAFHTWPVFQQRQALALLSKLAQTLPQQLQEPQKPAHKRKQPDETDDLDACDDETPDPAQRSNDGVEVEQPERNRVAC